MKRRGGWSRVVVAFSILCALVASAIPASAGVSAASSPNPGFSKAERERIVEAIARGETEITVLIAAIPGQNNTVVNGITQLGGEVRVNDGDVSYIRAIVPIDKAEAVATLNGIQGIDVKEIIPIEDPRPAGAQPVTPQPAPGAGTPRNNPYMPIGDTGAAQFMASNPTFDGRNVVVGVVDSGIDLQHPSLQTTSTGQRKIIDWVTYTDPGFTGGVNNDDDPTWIQMNTAPTMNGANTIAFNSQTLTLPNVAGIAANIASYRIGIFNERDPRLGGEVGNDVNRDGNPGGSSGIFYVLWDGAGRVWVDSNQNLNFNEPAMRNYRENFDVGTFGTDNPATALYEAMPFVVQIAPEVPSVNIGIVSGAHGSHVAGIIAANKMFGGQMSGAAPGAKLMSVRACLFVDGCTNYALMEGMIYLAKQRVNVINMSIGGLPALNDGNNARAALYDRLIDQYDVQMFISAGNDGAGVNTVGDPSVATKVLSVGSYISRDTWQKNYGSDSTLADNMHGFSSRGPREDGGFKPNIIAPGSAISTVPTWQAGGPLVGTYDLPPGYAMFNGTSMASPQAAGAAALLISAAKATTVPLLGSVQYKPAQLRQAMISSTRLINTSDYQVYEQGNGLINVGAAWSILRANKVQTVDITSSVDVNTPLEGFLATPNKGVGIYDRPVESAGAYTRQYTFTRTSGANGNKTYQVSWVGNDGTFSSASSVVLPKNTPVTFNVTIAPTGQGIHSAILNLNDTTTGGIDFQTMNVVIVPDEFASGNNYTVTKSETIGRNQVKQYFFNVPANTPALKIDLSGPDGTAGTGQVRFLRIHPYGVSIDANASTSCYSPAVSGCATGDPLSRTVANPFAGVWEVVVEARRTSDVAEAPFTLTTAILGATVSPNPDTIASASQGVPVARSYTLTNQFGAFTGRAVGTTLGSARIAQPTIADLQNQQFQINVAAGSSSLRVTIGATSDPSADLDLFLFNCTNGNCTLAGQSADGDSEESVTIANPTAGIWIALVDGFAVPSGSTTYKYIDVFANPVFGTIAVTDGNAVRAAGASWIVPATVTANAAPAAGRVLYGNVEVRTDTDILIGSGDVIVQSVAVP